MKILPMQSMHYWRAIYPNEFIITIMRMPSKPELYLRSFIYWIGFLVSALLLGTVVSLSFMMHVDTRFKLARGWAIFNLWTLGLLCNLRADIQGKENIIDESAVIMCKHQSTWETLMLQIEFPELRWVLKRELLRVPFFGWGLAMTEPIAIDRGTGRKAVGQMVEQGRKKLEDGYWVVVFPEGTRTKPGVPHRYKLGGAILATETGHPVVPVAHNAGEYWPRHSFIKWPGRIQVRIGPAISTKGKPPEQVIKEVRAWIETEMETISDPEKWSRAS